MSDLKTQRRLAATILKAGQNRVWIDPERIDAVEIAITREEIKNLIKNKVIKILPKQGISRSRAKLLHEKKKKGRRKGSGSRSGSSFSKISRKERWMGKIRALRTHLRALKSRKILTESAYRKLYGVAKSGRFNSIAELDRYAKAHELWRTR